MTSTKSKPYVVKIPLIDALEQEYQDWLMIKQSLGIKRSLKSFLYFIHNYGIPDQEGGSMDLPKDD
ncbi:MAG: hypothetical protein CMO44_16560 [Verrucomicrobiales bacterium]|jgi:hypothetical protein|nr:hypothetical protein [Verrucomicrobiales bacterium]|tara:strand:+ start:3407 stop:3604 length:198 start_codon:yes stop_codon:yes gene_type:complete